MIRPNPEYLRERFISVAHNTFHHSQSLGLPSDGNVITLSAIRRSRHGERQRRRITSNQIYSSGCFFFFLFCTNRFVTKCFTRDQQDTIELKGRTRMFLLSRSCRAVCISGGSRAFFNGGAHHTAGRGDISSCFNDLSKNNFLLF